MEKYSIFWFRRDLRLQDNSGLYAALRNSLKVIPVFIFDSIIISKLKKSDLRIQMIHSNLLEINKVIESYGSSIGMYKGYPKRIFKLLMSKYKINKVYTNRDYEPYAIKRDIEIRDFLKKNKISFETFKDQVIFERNEIVKNDGNPYKIYTPYSRKWIEKLENSKIIKFKSEKLLNNLAKISQPKLSISEIGFNNTKNLTPKFKTNNELIKNYESTRNFPALNGTTKAGPHLRFGTISIRELVLKANKQENKTFLKELIWREFFMQILWHFPETIKQSFKSKYDKIKWLNNKNEFKKWCKGKTGYPLVDAGMRELNSTGFIHNRVRMLVASFLCKHLLIDWRLGEAYFAEKLLDFEQSSNIGNWQWIAGCGVDSAPYFRIFNPSKQIEKFDKNFKYIKKWVPEFGTNKYPNKIVDHKIARERCIKSYKSAIN
ncbi:MAG: deoxyribodipyrimidine photo-lyase [Flavobacteriaceae bacterium]|nr:deoxyribodipyrimidine photo-lyase [Flavobacteriaceae bacterium]